MSFNKEIVRFFVGGTLVTATDFVIYLFLIRFLPFSAAKGISFVCAGGVGYLLNKYWTFQQNQSSYVEVVRYWLVNLAALGINMLINHSLLHIWPIGVMGALVSATIITSLFVYVGFKWWVFKSYLE